MNFTKFRSSIGAIYVRKTFGLDISNLSSWKDFTRAMLAQRAMLGGDREFVKLARCSYEKSSTGEAALLLAILFAADYRWLADELVEGRPSFLRLMEQTYGDYAEAAAACLANVD